MTDLDPAQIHAVEARIATELARLAHPRQSGGQPLAPAPYVRRHLSEHAAAGHQINDHILPRTFLPYVDLPRLRAALGATDGTMRLPLLPALRRASHLWNYNNPQANDTALHMWATALRLTAAEPVGFQKSACVSELRVRYAPLLRHDRESCPCVCSI